MSTKLKKADLLLKRKFQNKLTFRLENILRDLQAISDIQKEMNMEAIPADSILSVLRGSLTDAQSVYPFLMNTNGRTAWAKGGGMGHVTHA